MMIGVGLDARLALPFGRLREAKRLGFETAVRAFLPAAPVYLAALGPQMLRLAGGTADGVLNCSAFR